MSNTPVAEDRIRDPIAQRDPGRWKSRDPQRTPMRWDGSPQAGFTTGTPWLPVGDDATSPPVQKQLADPQSMLALYRRLLALRRAEPALTLGQLELVGAHPEILAYRRVLDDKRFLMLLNFSDSTQVFTHPGLSGKLELSTSGVNPGRSVSSSITLAPGEGWVIRLT
jgi:alpha-glucosidase